MLAIKFIENEFAAFAYLIELKKVRENGIVPLVNPVTRELNWVDEKTEAILTSAILGFANVGSSGIILAIFGEKH